MTTRIIRIAAVLCALSLTTGCLKDISRNSTPENNDDYFDFKIEQRTALVVDYGFPNKDYVVMVEVYDQNPLVEQNGEYIKKANLEPIYRAATDKAGKLSASIQISSALTKVWLYSEYPGTLSPVEIEIKDNMIAFNQNAYIAQRSKTSSISRAATGNDHTYPDGWLTLGDWDQYGTPDYLDPIRTMPPASTLYNINEVFVKYNGAKLITRYPDFFASGLSSDIHVIKPTKIYLVFINSTAAWSNTVGYFTYPTGQEPQKSEVQRILAFPNASPYLKKVNEAPVRGALIGGDRVQLKYWDGERFVDEFPAGVSIGWWLEGRGFDNSNLVIQSNGRYSRFSIDSFNEDNNRRTVALRDSKSQRIVAIGFEDNIDLRYNDATFYLEVEEDDAIDGNIPEMPDVGGGPAEEENYVKTDGFLMFEDMWPRGADYDMNDVMIKYSTKVYKHILNNLVYKIETEYLPFYKGGILTTGFGIQLSNIPGVVRKVTIDGAAPSRYMEGQMLEPGQTKPTVLLFDNLAQVLDKTIRFTAEINDAPESSVALPYNPFIFTDSHKTRGQEVHLVKNMPTDKADITLFGTGDDGSDPASGLYYVLRKKERQYPFALNMPFMQNIPIPAEGVNIDITYPKFRNWVESGGTSNRDWYLYPVQN